MKLLVDMNLSPRWVDYLAAAGFSARHWSDWGAANASDRTLLDAAQQDNAVVLTNGLDFGTLLALGGQRGPSVLLLRAAILSPEVIGLKVVESLRRFAGEIDAGALIVIDERRSKLRLLPIPRGSHD